MRLRFINLLGALWALVAVLSCSGDAIAPPTSADAGVSARVADSTLLAGLNASAPVANAYDPLDAAARASVGLMLDVSWVSLVPGTVSDGTSATITNLRTAQSAMVAIVNGGFDPLPVSATFDDTLQVTVSRADKPDATAFVRIAARLAPRIVRTRPPRGQTDAPLNTVITIVFSEPLDPASVNTTSVVLSASGSPVASTVRLAPGAAYTVELEPSALLLPNTMYSLTVSGVVNLAGTPLATPVSIAFTTGTTTTSQPEYYPHEAGLGPANPILITGDSAWMIGVVYRGTGVAPDTLEWVISDPSIASIDVVDKNRVIIRALGAGAATIFARTRSSRPELSASTNVTVIARSNAASPIVAETFSILEYHDLDFRYYIYVPDLRLRDTSAAQDARVVGITIDLPGATRPMYCAANRVIGSGSWTVFPPPGDMNGTALSRTDWQRIPDVSVNAVAHVNAVLADGLGVSFTVTGKVVPVVVQSYFESGLYPPVCV